MMDARSSVVTIAKWVFLFLLGYFLLHPIAGIYEKSDYRAVIFMVSLTAGIIGVDIPIAALRRRKWKEEVKRALYTEPPKT